MTATAAAPARIGDVARAFAREGMWRGVLAIVIGATLGALLSVTLGLLLALSPFRDIWVSWPLPWLNLSDAFLVLAVLVCWQVASLLLLDRRLRRAQEAQAWMGERELAAWQRGTGAGRWSLPPSTPGAAERWLERHPLDTTNGYARVEVMLLAERFEEASAALAELVPRSDAERIARADLLATLRLLAEGEVDLDKLSAATAAASGDDNLAGRCSLALMESRRALRAGGNWLQPLEAVRDELGTRANGILWRRFLPRRLLATAPVGGLVLLGFGLLRLLMGTGVG